MDKFIMKENGLYKYTGTIDDVFIEINEWITGVNAIDNIKRCEADNNYITFNTYRGTEYEGYDAHCVYNMMEGDVVYTDLLGDYINYSDNFIVWMKIDNLDNDCVKVFYLPKVLSDMKFENEKYNEKALFDLAIRYNYSGIDNHLFHEKTVQFICPYAELITYDEHLKHVEEYYESKFNMIQNLL